MMSLLSTGVLMPLLFAAGANPLEHVKNHPTVVSEDGWWIWSANQTNLVLTGVIMLVLGPWLAKQIRTGPADEGTDRYVTKHIFARLVEVICLYLKNEAVGPLLGKRADRFMPFLWTLFFFILINNLLGLVPLLDAWHAFKGEVTHTAPIGGTATQNPWVNAMLAICSFAAINIAGIRQLGVKGYLMHLTGGAPWYIWPIIVPIEVISIFVKPFALTVRLFANMTAGHTLMATFFMFIGLVTVPGVSLAISGPVTVLSAVAATALYFLELFVAFLQAFIFMFLTAVFIALLSHHDHNHEHGHEHAHGHEHDHGHGPAVAHA